MAKIKVFELKNQINSLVKNKIESKDIIDFIETNFGVKKSHSSALEENEANFIKNYFVHADKADLQTTDKKIQPAILSEINVQTDQMEPLARPEKKEVKKAAEQKADTAEAKVQAKDKKNEQHKAQSAKPAQKEKEQAKQAKPSQQQKPAETESAKQKQTGSKPAESKPAESRVTEPKATEQKATESVWQKHDKQPQPDKNRQAKTQQANQVKPSQQKTSQPAAQKAEADRKGGKADEQAGRQQKGELMSGKQQRHEHEAGHQAGKHQRSDGQSKGAAFGQGGKQQGGGARTAQHGKGGSGFGKSFGKPAYKDEEIFKDEDDKSGYNHKQGKKAGQGKSFGERKKFDQQILEQKVSEKNDNKRKADRINKEKNYRERNLNIHDEDDMEDIRKLVQKKNQSSQPKPAPAPEEEIKLITIPEVLTIKELADKMKKPSAALIKKLLLQGKVVTLNHEITFEEAEEIALEYDIICEKEKKVNELEELLKDEEDPAESLVKRPPVVCVMGHVDHGKTSLLDAIRQTNVTAHEAGGITQHIGASVVDINGEKITFLDTPGHEAFTSMRMRGAQCTDIAILVVAADDGVMPQTVEAISHARAAGVTIIVAVNKIDKPSANVERVKQELTEHDLIAEDWGGDTIFVPVSAHTKEGIDQLLEMVLLSAEMLELKANPNRKARGTVIEAQLDKGRGPVATVLVQKGTLHVGDNIVVGSSYGKVRAMTDDKGRRVKEATPSTPVEIIGLNQVPEAGETFIVTNNEKEARHIADVYMAQSKEKLIADTKAKLSLDGLFSQIQAGNIKELNLIVKADVQGSVEAMKQSLTKLSNEEIAIRIIHGGVGAINESDVTLASTSNAIIIGFNVRPDNAAKDMAEREKVEIKMYRVIYDAINDIEAAMKGMLAPVYEEKIIGHAEVRATFKASDIGTIAGSYVTDGKIQRNCRARIYRDNKLIHEGNLASLKRFQDDVKEVAAGYECGLVFEKFNDVRESDKVEFYIMAEVQR